jgi:hypothetical protein
MPINSALAVNRHWMKTQWQVSRVRAQHDPPTDSRRAEEGDPALERRVQKQLLAGKGM